MAIDHDRARQRLELIGNAFEDRRFARAIRPDERYDFAPADIQGNVANERFPIVTYGQRLQGKIFLRHELTSLCAAASAWR